METEQYTSDMYPIREPREKIEGWKRHAREKYEMNLASMIRWLINLDMKGLLPGQQNRKVDYVHGQETILLKERLHELEKELELKNTELTSINFSRDVRLMIFQALNLGKEVRSLFSDQPGLSANIETIAGALGIPESSVTDRRALEFVLSYLISTGFLRFKGGRYSVNG